MNKNICKKSSKKVNLCMIFLLSKKAIPSATSAAIWRMLLCEGTSELLTFPGLNRKIIFV